MSETLKISQYPNRCGGETDWVQTDAEPSLENSTGGRRCAPQSAVLSSSRAASSADWCSPARSCLPPQGPLYRCSNTNSWPPSASFAQPSSRRRAEPSASPPNRAPEQFNDVIRFARACYLAPISPVWLVPGAKSSGLVWFASFSFKDATGHCWDTSMLHSIMAEIRVCKSSGKSCNPEPYASRNGPEFRRCAKASRASSCRAAASAARRHAPSERASHAFSQSVSQSVTPLPAT